MLKIIIIIIIRVEGIFVSLFNAMPFSVDAAGSIDGFKNTKK